MTQAALPALPVFLMSGADQLATNSMNSKLTGKGEEVVPKKASPS